MRSRLCVCIALVALACSKEPGAPDDDGADDAMTGTEGTETGEPVECGQLDEVECEAAPSCYPISGTPIAADLSCREQPGFAFCSAQDSCNDAETNYLDPEGGCWWFSADCILDQGGWQGNSDQCPQYEEFQMLPECS